MNKLYSEIEKILDYKFKDINLAELPAGESLKDVIIRLQPFLEKFLSEIKLSKKNFLIKKKTIEKKTNISLFKFKNGR